MNTETIARPYAQAIFEHSEGWLEDLKQVSNVIEEPEVAQLIDSPKLAYKKKAERFIGLFGNTLQSKTINFLKIVGSAKRLSLIPSILKEYQELLAQKDKRNEVLIISAYKPKAEQMEQIDAKLRKRYGENLSLTLEVNKSLMGGYIIKCKDDVIDFSVKGRLQKLRNQII